MADRVALVTGGNRGIGREVCRQLAERGYTVLLTARQESAALSATRELAAAGDIRPLRVDVTDRAGIHRAAAAVAGDPGRLDVLVNNAAITYDTWQRAATADLDVVHTAAETNLYGPWRMVQEFLPLLRGSGDARIVNVSSEAGSLASMGSGPPAYNVTKTALHALTRMLAAELGRDGILVNAVCPGWVATDMGGAGGRPVGDGAATASWSTRSAPAGWPPTWAGPAGVPSARGPPAWSGPPRSTATALPGASSATDARCRGSRAPGRRPDLPLRP